MSTFRGSTTIPPYPHGERWRRMRVMHTAFEHAASDDSVRPGERSEEELRDEQAQSRMDDEGYPPNGRQSPHLRKANGMKVKGSSGL